MIHTILWDFNGTILDDVQLCLSILNGMLTRRGKTALTHEEYRNVFGFPIRDYYVRAGFNLKAESFSCVAAEFMAEYQPNSLSLPMRAGIMDAITVFNAYGLRQGILSASKLDNLLEQTRALGIDGAFDFILGIDDIFASSKEEIARRWALDNNVTSSCVLAIGDTAHDHEVALALGFNCALLTGGHQGEACLRATGRPVFDKISDILKWMEAARFDVHTHL